MKWFWFGTMVRGEDRNEKLRFIVVFLSISADRTQKQTMEHFFISLNSTLFTTFKRPIPIGINYRLFSEGVFAGLSASYVSQLATCSHTFTCSHLYFNLYLLVFCVCGAFDVVWSHTTMTVKMSVVFWVVTPCWLVGGTPTFLKNKYAATIFRAAKTDGVCFPLKRWYQSSSQHNITILKTSYHQLSFQTLSMASER